MICSDELFIFLVVGQLGKKDCSILPDNFSFVFYNPNQINNNWLEFLQPVIKGSDKGRCTSACVDKHLPVLFSIIFDTQFEKILDLLYEHVKSLNWELVVLKTYLFEVRYSTKWMKNTESIHLKLTSICFAHKKYRFENSVLMSCTLGCSFWHLQHSCNQVKSSL